MKSVSGLPERGDKPYHPFWRQPPPHAAYPETLRITSRPFEEHKENAIDRTERWEDGHDVPYVVNFQDASQLQRVLTPRRLELVKCLMDGPAESIRDLADRLDRDVRQVHDDLQLLHGYRIVHFREADRAKAPFVPYERVTIEVELSRDASAASA